MSKRQKICISLLLVVILTLISSSLALSQSAAGSWIRRRLTKNNFYSFSPAIAVSGGNVHVVWYEDPLGIYQIHYKRSSDNGATWGKAKLLTHNKGSSAWPSIAVSGVNIHVVWMDYTPGNYEIFYRRSTDNGVTWRKKKRLTKNAGDSRDPVITVSGRDIHVVWSDSTPGNAEIYHKMSTDNGATWGGETRLTDNTGDSEYPTIAGSGSNIHVAWHDDSPGNADIFYIRSTDNGVTWRKKKNLTKNPRDSRNPSIALSGNKIHVVWYDYDPFNLEIYHKRSSDNGVTWGADRRLTKTAGMSMYSTVAVSGGNVDVIWQDDTPGNWEIFYKHSSNNGVTWGKKKRLSKNTGLSSTPAIASSSTNVHVVWEDDSPGNAEILYKRGP